jgi:starch synthase
MINKIKLDGVPLDAISDLEYESIIKATIKHYCCYYSQIVSPSLTKFIESSGKPLPFVPKMNGSVYQFLSRKVLSN